MCKTGCHEKYIPYSAWHWIQFNWFVRLWHLVLFGLMRVIKLWGYPLTENSMLNKYFTNLNWLHKSIYPVVKSEMTDYFSENKIVFDDSHLERTLRISFLGDLLVHDKIADSGSVIFDGIDELLDDSDLIISNLEGVFSNLKRCPMTDMHSPIQMTFNKNEFDIVTSFGNSSCMALNFANNHSFDLGVDGLNQTLDLVQKSNSIPFGLSNTQGIKVIDCNGCRIGLVGVTYGVNNRILEADNYINIIDMGGNRRDLLAKLKCMADECKKQHVDLIIACLHWGEEFELYPRPFQIKMAKEIAELGFDAVIGQHNHMLQPFEIYESSDFRKVPIFYGIGNMTSLFSHPYNVLSLHLILDIGIVNGKYSINSLSYNPLIQVEDNYDQIRIVQLKKYLRREVGLLKKRYVSSGYRAKVIEASAFYLHCTK